MRLKGRLAIPALVLMVWVCGSGWAAQETGQAEAPTEGQGSTPEEASRTKMDWLRLYVSVARGAADADTVNSSIRTSLTRSSENGLTMEEVYNRAVFGWQLPKNKGDFRLVFTGFREDGYEFDAVGRDGQIDPTLSGPQNGVLNNLDWWTVKVVDGNLNSKLSPPQWNVMDDDANGDGAAERSEVFYLEGDELAQCLMDQRCLDFDRTITGDLQNRSQTVDVVYGRTFGKRRFTGHWWGGLRHAVYEGNVPAAAWLKPTGPAQGFTDGAFLKFINFTQDFSGTGATGAIDFEFNFFNRRLTLFAGGQFAFLFGTVETDSGDFNTLFAHTGNTTIPVSARLEAKRDKTTWQTGADLGARVRLADDLHLELGYFVTGHLDVILLPTEMRIPQGEAEAQQGSSALFNTQDLVFDGWRAGVSFQF